MILLVEVSDNMKGQLFAIDLLVALTLFFAVIGIAAYLWLIIPDYEIYNLQEKAHSISSHLVSSKLGNENIVSCEKLYDFSLKNYEEIKTELAVGPDDIWIKFENMSSDTCPGIRLNLDVMLILDTSASMGVQKIQDAKDAANYFVDELDKNHDQAGLVSYSTFVTLDQTLLSMTDSNKTVLKGKIDSLSASGNTNIGGGVDYANNELLSERARTEKVIKVEILLSDGRTNIPNGEEYAKQYALEKAKEAYLNNIKIYTISLGSDADRDLMQNIADLTGGKEYYVPTSSELQNIFYDISKEITVVTDYGKIAPSTVLNIASVVRVVKVGKQNLRMNVKIY